MKKLLCILMICCSLEALSQADPSDGDGVTGTVPVDGGLTLLLAAGAAYGAGRLRRRAEP